MSDKYDFFRAYISSFLHGKPNAEAILQSLADESIKLHELSVAVTDQLTISTASDIYLDKRLAEVGITRPSELGMDDLSFRQMGIQLNASKQVIESIHTILATFYGDETVRASATSGQPEPYFLEDGDILQFVLESEEVHTVTFLAENFDNIQQASAKEVADLITRYIRGRGLQGYAQEYADVDTGLKYVRIFGSAKGPYGLVQILGGQGQTEMEFPTIRATNLPVNDTVWEITRTVGSTHRFRWVSGSKPLLEKIFIEDKALIYGNQFLTVGIYGTFDVKNVRPAQASVAVDAGWFEIDIEGFSALKSSIPDQNPPPNSPGNVYSFTITQAQFADLKFFLARKNTAYGQQRYALAWEPEANLLHIYMPASTKVVRRDLVGSAHLHLLYKSDTLNGSYGHPTDPDQMIQILSDRSFRFRQSGYDASGTGGTVTYGITTKDIEYAFRENGYANVITIDPHGLTPQPPDAFGRVFTTQIAVISVANVPQDDQVNTFLGPYVLDPAAPYTLTSEYVTTREQVLAGENRNSLFVQGALIEQSGQLLFDLNLDTQEGPVPFWANQVSAIAPPVNITSISQSGTNVTVIVAGSHGAIIGSQINISGTLNFNGTYAVTTVPSSSVYTFTKTPSNVLFEATGVSTLVITGTASTLILDPSYQFKFTHDTGSNVSLISDNKAYEPVPNGLDYGAYVTGTADGRIFAEQLMREITALGINLEITIIFPVDTGLGNAGGSDDANNPPTSEKIYVWGS